MAKDKNGNDNSTSYNGGGEGEEHVKLADADFSQLQEEQVADFAEDAGHISSASEVKDSGDELSKLRAENREIKDRYLRALADFENFKKRSVKDRADLLKYQGEKILLDMLEIVDNLEYALQYSENSAGAEGDPAKLKEGLALIYKRFVETLAKWEVRAESAVGSEFDPAKSSAISRVAASGVQPGTVLNELKKAYFYKDKLLRVGEVVVAGDSAEGSISESDTSSDNSSKTECV